MNLIKEYFKEDGLRNKLLHYRGDDTIKLTIIDLLAIKVISIKLLKIYNLTLKELDNIDLDEITLL